MSLVQRYQQLIDAGEIESDSLQRAILPVFQRLYDELEGCQPPRKSSLLEKMRLRSREPVKGIYLWGGVGRGKTFLMDLCFENLPLESKFRVHFSHFMKEIHSRLLELPKQPDPIKVIAKDVSDKLSVLFLDEFHVDDITDAMILAEALQALFEQGITLVTTSNIVPEQLYKNGLQRSRFLPAIELINRYTDVVQLGGAQDYRLSFLDRDGTYHVQVNGNEYELLAEQFGNLSRHAEIEQQQVVINHQKLSATAVRDGVVWFDFQELCDKPRSSSDYIELARCFHTVIMSGIPVMSEGQNDQAQRFIQFVDALYDHSVKLVASAAAEPPQLYRGRTLAFSFERTASRLAEMRSHDYLAKAHKTH